MTRLPGFIEGSNEQTSISADYSRTINMMPRIVGATGKNQTVLVGTPGLTAHETIAAGDNVRGIWEGDLTAGNYYYVVVEGTLYKASTATGDTTSLGSVGEDANSMPVRIAVGDNTQDTLIVSNGTAYQLVGSVLTAISDLTGVTCLDCAYIGGYFVVITDEYTFRISGVGDITSWDALDYDYPDTQPEPLIGVISNNGQLWFFGKTRTSVWMLDSTVDFGMSRVKGVNIQFGCWSNATLHVFDNGIIWVASSGNGIARVCLARNYAPSKISTHYVDTVLDDNKTNLSKAYAYITDNQGHEVYHLSIPGASTTLCLDASTQRWHERAYWGGSAYALHLGKCHMSKGGVHYMGARNSGIVYTMSPSVYQDNGEDIRRLRRAPHVHEQDRPLRYNRFSLDFEKILGADGTNPLMYMRYSSNGGKTFSTAQSAAMGETDDNPDTIRAEWHRLGTGTDYVFEVYSTANIRHTWTDAYLDIR